MAAKEQENHQWSRILDACGMGAWKIDSVQRIVSLSSEGAAILGLSGSQTFPIESFAKLFHPPFDNTISHSLERFLQTNQEFEETVALVSGSWVRIRGKVIPDGASLQTGGMLQSLLGKSHFPSVNLSTGSDHLYRYLFEENPLPMFIWELDTLNIIDCNRQALLKYGYTREEFLQLNIRDIRPTEDIPLIEKHTQQPSAYGDIHQRVWRHCTKAGEVMQVRITSHLVDIGGKRCSMVLINDITEMLEAEEQLLESLKELSDYRFALDESCLVMILDNKKRVVYLNQKFQNISGFGKDSIEEATLKTLYDNRDWKLIENCWETLISEDIWCGELRGKKRKGGVFWVDTVVIPFRDNQGKIYQYIWVGYDITEKKRTDDALIKERSLLRAIIDNLPIQIYVKDTSGKHIINNRYQYEHSLGAKTEGETLGKTVFDYFPKEIAEGMAAYDRKIIREGKPEMNVEEFYFDHKGNRVWLLTNKVPLKDAKGNVVGLVGMSRDVTDRKKEEENLKNLNDELQKKALALEKSNEELEQFAYIASHDLQEPLRMITGFLGLLEKKYEPVLDEKGKEFIHFAVDGASRMKNIIMDLLAYSRVGRMEEKVKEVAIEEIVNNILKLHKELIQQKGAEITLGKFPKLKIPVAPIHQVFQNLINNALKYQEPNQQPKIRIQAEEKPDFWEFRVTDNGIGIPESFQSRVFILFSRLHANKSYSGSGIGLAMSKKIIENLGGSIGFHSEEGKGSTFFFTVPKSLQKAK
ncbi:PAS domain-containing sensor histidine kinase [Cyclobacterium jeungdonense]|uniref:histidine kinase n=1 Tax=Cyclobacterium jeungdonense TaxID=708087 RepID=A0ABT8C6U5_9BACT|nr:PAS domain-containing sensor histidine kinase [Cyclobacterium jeungdonense]MDN3687792.1 PAS domain S-box protein [Cyclobacterium jeungdonense]